MQTVNKLDYVYRELNYKAYQNRNETIEITDEDYLRLYDSTLPIEPLPDSDIPIPIDTESNPEEQENENNLYTDICKFNFDNTIHQSQIMYKLLKHDYDAGDGNSAVQLNTFYHEGSRYWKLKSYNSEEQYIFSAIEQRQNYIIPNNGIIIMNYFCIHNEAAYTRGNPTIILAKCPDCNGNLILYYDESINEYYVICENCNHSQTLNFVSNGLGDEHYGNIEPHNTMIKNLYYYSNTFQTHTIIGCDDAIEISES